MGVDRQAKDREGGRRPAEGMAERLLAERLTEGPMEEADRERRIRANLSPRYEVRIQTEYDPIVEETKRYRSMAREIDDRYDRYMKRTSPAAEPGCGTGDAGFSGMQQHAGMPEHPGRLRDRSELRDQSDMPGNLDNRYADGQDQER